MTGDPFNFVLARVPDQLNFRTMTEEEHDRLISNIFPKEPPGEQEMREFVEEEEK